jgi:hypothetical protein
MPSFLVLVIYLVLFLSGDGERAGWNRFLRGSYVEEEGDNYGINNFTGGPFFPDDDIKAEMISPPWNNFLRSLSLFLLWLDLVMTKD